MDKLDATLVRGTDGRISIPETIAQFHNDLNLFLSKEQSDTNQIADAVTGFWEENPALKSVSLDAIASQVFTKLSAPPGAFKDLTDRVKNYIRTNTETFYVGKGKDGGVRLLDRMTAEEVAKAVTARAKATAKKNAVAA